MNEKLVTIICILLSGGAACVIQDGAVIGIPPLLSQVITDLCIGFTVGTICATFLINFRKKHGGF